MEIERVNDYPFMPLNPPSSQIRLVRFQRDRSGSIIGWLENYSIEDPKRPNFIALSYVWGVAQFSHKMVINGSSFLTLESLSPILGVICDDALLKGHWWWIDCICINQGIDETASLERSAQVNIMNKIYEKAEEVVGWLGQGDKECEQGIKFLRVVFRNGQRLRDQREMVELGDELNDPKPWASLEKLLLQPWWTRVWTLQEYIVARKFTFRYGKEKIDRKQLNAATIAIDICMKVEETLISNRAFHAAWVRRRLLNLYQKRVPMRLTALMAYVGDSKATDPRDRIYSLLGLAEDRYLSEAPAYQDDVNEVYIGLVKSFVQLYNDLDIICFVDRFPRFAADPSLESLLPSWVPDWRVATIPAVVPLMVSQTAGHHIGNCRPPRHMRDDAISYAAGRIKGPLQVTFSDDSRMLNCQGIMIDYIDGVGGLKLSHGDTDGGEAAWNRVYDSINSTSSANIHGTREAVSQNKINAKHATMLLERIGRCLLLNRTDRYLKYESPVGYLFDEFQPLCRAAIETPGATQLHPRFLDWFQRNKDLHIQGHSFEEICKASEKFEKPREIKLNDMSNMYSFLSRFTDTTMWMFRRLMTTNMGRIGMVSCRARKGDQIWVLLGCSVPVVLRRCDSKQSYEVVGECYIEDYMKGEIIEDLRGGTANLEDVHLL